MNSLIISGSPHIHGNHTVKTIMWSVVIALLPALAVSVYFFGIQALTLTAIAIASCMLFEAFIQRFLLKTDISVLDGSAIITGLLLAFNVPSSLPWWQMVIGAMFAIGVGKMSFGGLGKNVFNPALAGRVFLLISFPVDMTLWPKPQVLGTITDAVTGPTALGVLKGGLMKGEAISSIMTKLPDYQSLFVGQVGGSMGEVSALAIIIGGLYMLIRKVITWHIPVSFILSSVILSGIFWLINPEQYADPVFHLLAGGLMLGAVFMATDMVTSPMTNKGMLIFGAGCGLLTIIIRLWGAYPEGVSFAILIMNAFTPIINNAVKPKRFGEEKSNG
jgi:Na+-translocating ferredoxin:NAD+ oxidoreductase subunit D